MIALAEKSRRKKQSKPSAPTFEELLPAIKKQARVAFRDSTHNEREELMAEVIANAFCAYQRLVERGLGHVIFTTPLTTFTIKKPAKRVQRFAFSIHEKSSGASGCALLLTVPSQTHATRPRSKSKPQTRHVR